MIATLIKNYGEIGAYGILILMMAWYLYHTVKAQSERSKKREIRDEKREDKILNMVDTSLKNIEITTTKNKALNKQIAIIQERTLKVMDAHRMEAEKNSKHITEIIRNTLEMSNGGNPFIKKILKRLDKIEKKP